MQSEYKPLTSSPLYDKIMRHVDKDQFEPYHWRWRPKEPLTGFMARPNFVPRIAVWYICGRPIYNDGVLGCTCDNPECVNPDHQAVKFTTRVTGNALTELQATLPNIRAPRHTSKDLRDNIHSQMVSVGYPTCKTCGIPIYRSHWYYSVEYCKDHRPKGKPRPRTETPTHKPKLMDPPDGWTLGQ